MKQQNIAAEKSFWAERTILTAAWLLHKQADICPKQNDLIHKAAVQMNYQWQLSGAQHSTPVIGLIYCHSQSTPLMVLCDKWPWHNTFFT